MNIVLIIFISVIILLISFWLCKQAAGTLSLYRINTISYVFYTQILLSGYIGSVIVALGFSSNHYMISLVSDQTKIWSWSAVMYSMVAMPLAMILFNNLIGLSPKYHFHKYLNKSISFSYSRKSAFKLIFILLIFSLLTLVYVFYHTKDIPLISLLRKVDILTVMEQRVASKRKCFEN